nr:transposase (putative), gypsy type [Tanacetum cinerariifolium]
MSELPDDSIGIYHWIFDFSSVRIPFSSFLLALIKHYRVHFSQLGPLGLNKKSGFFLIDWRAIANAMVWRHPDVANDDPRPAVGSFNMDDVRRLSAHVVKLRDMPKGVLVCGLLELDKSDLSAKKDRDLYHSRLTQDVINDLIIKYKIPRDLHPWLPFEEFVMSELPDDAIDWRAIANAMVWRHPDVAIDDPRPAAGLFNMDDVRRLSTHVVKMRDMPKDWWAIENAMVWRHPDVAIDDPRPAAGSFNMDDVRRLSAHFWAFMVFSVFLSGPVLRSRRSLIWMSALAQSSGSTTCPSFFVVAMVPSSGNLGGRFIAPAAEGSNTRDSWGKGVMVDDAAAPSAGVSRPRPSSGLAPSFRDVSGEAIYTDFFPFFVGPYYATYLEDGVDGNYSRLKGYEENVASLTGLQGELLSLATSAVFERRLSMHRTKNEFAIMPKKMVNFMHGSQDRLTLKPEKLVRPINVPTPREPRASPPIAKDLIVNAMVDGSIAELTNGAAYSNSGGVFMHGNSHVLDDVAGVTVVGSERVTSSLTDVVVVLSAGEKGDGSLPFFPADEEATTNPSGV